MSNYFTILLTLVTIVSGLIWLVDSLFLAPKRKEKLLTTHRVAKVADEPYLVDTAKQLFPIITFVLILRSFIFEPFQIPSGSMIPTLLVGDFILVEKFAYGLRDPVWRSKIINTGEPKRGDVAVFKYPLDPSIDYIKRIVGLPGDTVVYSNKKIFLKPACHDKDKCEPMKRVSEKFVNRGKFYQGDYPLELFNEQLGNVYHYILINPSQQINSGMFFSQEGTEQNEWVVPPGQYFAMGDNRDNSSDSRYWGFVPEENLVGKAVAIWISFEFSRNSYSWLPGWIPTGIRFERFGSIK
ncbi:signal peptidase I [Alteromonas sp. 14N.309.X.WAT.G.H12]|uniref:signal peptidase I n=1 Tax=Alteromonas sp. 14N.309.X.WAT.G.H12 TaxID=3120824 RepID=UPI002FD2C5D3